MLGTVAHQTPVILRSHNDMPLVAQTLAALYQQDEPYELTVLDNDSTDGTQIEIRKYTDRIITVPKGTYVPGTVLNLAMENTGGDVVVFLNSDCTPRSDTWLKNILRGFDDENVAATFGQQIPRDDCNPLFARDTEDTYGDGRKQLQWRHCFSLASAAIRRDVWDKLRFNEDLQYSEDVEWTWRARQLGYTIRYASNACVTHSHNYTPTQLYKRQYGEGRAEANIFAWSTWERSLLRYSIMPFIRQVADDTRYCVPRCRFGSVIRSPVFRMFQLLGRRAGFRAGLTESEQNR